MKLAPNFGAPETAGSVAVHGADDTDIDSLIGDVMQGAPAETEAETEPEPASEPEPEADPEEPKPKAKPKAEPEAEAEAEPEEKPKNEAWAKLRLAEKASRARLAEAEAKVKAQLAADYTAKQTELAAQAKLLDRPGLKHLAKYSETGDTAYLVEFLEAETGESYDELQKAILERRRRSPAEARAMKEAQELRERLEKLERERETQSTQQTAEQVRASEMRIITDGLAGTDVARVPGFAKHVHSVLSANRGPDGRTRLTLEEGGKLVLERYQAWLSRNQLAPVPKSQPAKPAPPAAQAKRTGVTVHNPSKGKLAGAPAPGNGDEDDIDLILAQTGFKVERRR